MHKDENIEKNIIFLKSILFKRLIKKNKLIIMKDKKIKSLLLKKLCANILGEKKSNKTPVIAKKLFLYNCLIVKNSAIFDIKKIRKLVIRLE